MFPSFSSWVDLYEKMYRDETPPLTVSTEPRKLHTSSLVYCDDPPDCPAYALENVFVERRAPPPERVWKKMINLPLTSDEYNLQPNDSILLGLEDGRFVKCRVPPETGELVIDSTELFPNGLEIQKLTLGETHLLITLKYRDQVRTGVRVHSLLLPEMYPCVFAHIDEWGCLTIPSKGEMRHNMEVFKHCVFEHTGVAHIGGHVLVFVKRRNEHGEITCRASHLCYNMLQVSVIRNFSTSTCNVSTKIEFSNYDELNLRVAITPLERHRTRERYDDDAKYCIVDKFQDFKEYYQNPERYAERRQAIHDLDQKIQSFVEKRTHAFGVLHDTFLPLSTMPHGEDDAEYLASQGDKLKTAMYWLYEPIRIMEEASDDDCAWTTLTADHIVYVVQTTRGRYRVDATGGVSFRP